MSNGGDNRARSCAQAFSGQRSTMVAAAEGQNVQQIPEARVLHAVVFRANGLSQTVLSLLATGYGPSFESGIVLLY